MLMLSLLSTNIPFFGWRGGKRGSQLRIGVDSSSLDIGGDMGCVIVLHRYYYTYMRISAACMYTLCGCGRYHKKNFST